MEKYTETIIDYNSPLLLHEKSSGPRKKKKYIDDLWVCATSLQSYLTR